VSAFPSDAALPFPGSPSRSRNRTSEQRLQAIELLRRAYTIQFDRLSPGSVRAAIQAFVDLLGPEVEFEPLEDEPGERAVRGREAVMRLLEEASEDWDACRYEAHECIHLGEDRVMVTGRVIARGRDGGAEVDLPFAHVWTLRDGLASRIEAYADAAQARDSL
jgi:uncharacterized protein